MSSFGYSPIIGYIVAGVILGPSCCKLIQNQEVIGIFSEMGILFLLFAIGLNLSLEKMKNIWKTSFIATLLSTVIIYAGILLVGHFLLVSHAKIVLMAFCVALSSTAVTAKSLKLLKERDESIEYNTIGILIVQDLVALVMVLIVDILGAKVEHLYDIYKNIIVMLAASVVAFYFLHSMHFTNKLSHFLKKHNDMIGICVFGICLGSAVIAELAGLSAAFGAFIAGLMLGNSSIKEQIRSTASPIEEILLMTFFLGVGLLVDLRFMVNNFKLIFLALLFVAFGKTIINIFVLRLCKFSLKDAFVISVLLANTGEFSFMLCYTASRVGLVDYASIKFLANLTVMSLVLSPFWLVIAQRCLHLAKRVNIASSKEFYKLALDNEIRKIKHISKTMVNFIEKTFRREKK
jgi:CPA2 family monovalent cation:H+ antiporter-2